MWKNAYKGIDVFPLQGHGPPLKQKGVFLLSGLSHGENPFPVS